MEEDLRARLLADADIGARVGSRIDWVERPKASGLPALTLTLASEVPTWNYRAQDVLVPSRVQIDVWGASARDAILLSRLLAPLLAQPAVHGATRFGPAYLELKQDGGTEEIAAGALVYRRILDFTVWHSPA